jgi:Na+/phosphate symporter
MMQKQGELAQVVKMQKKNTDVYDTVLNYVKNYLQRPETEKQRKIRERLNTVKLRQEKMKKEDFERRLKQQGDTEFSYQVIIILY